MILVPDILPDGRLDIIEICDYLNEHSDTAADRFQGAVHKTIERLCESPDSGTKCRFKNLKYTEIRMITVDKPFNKYLIFFRQAGETIQILRIMHGARNYETLFD